MFKSSLSRCSHKDNLHLANVVISILLLASMLLSSCGAVGSEGVMTVTPADSGQESVVATQPVNTSQSQIDGENSTYTPPVYTRPTPVTGGQADAGDQGDLTPSVTQTMAQTPMMFIENEGQFNRGARFEVPGQQGTMYLADDSIWLSLVNAPVTDEPSTTSMESFQERSNTGLLSPAMTATPTPDSQKLVTGVNLRFSFEGANSSASLEGFNPLDTKVSYFIGNDQSKWHADVPVWGGVRYKNIYQGYDLEITSQDGVWMWNLVQSKDAASVTENDPSLPQGGKAGTQNEATNLRLRVEGAKNLVLDGNALKITTDIGEVAFPLPTLGQSKTNTSRATQSSTSGAYLDGNEVVLPISVPTSGMNIIPETTGTPVSMNSDKATRGRSVVHFDQTEALYTMSSSQWDMEDLFYSTYLGDGFGGQGISVDSSGNAYIVGFTYSNDFPTTPGAFQTSLAGGYDAFITKLNANGSGVSYSTYLGGSGTDCGYDVALDGSGAAYIAGSTWSSNFPTTEGAYSRVNTVSAPFVVKLNADGTALDYSTFIGQGQGFNIAVNSSGNAYIVGQTGSSFPTTSGAYKTTFGGVGTDGFVTEFNTTGTGLIFSTYLSGVPGNCEIGGDARECDIALGLDNSVYVGGITYASNFPTTSEAYDRTYNGNGDTFVLRLSSNGSSLIFSTYLGGSSTDDCNGKCSLTVDDDGNVYIAGTTISSNFPVTSGAYDTTYNGGQDITLTKLSANGSNLIYSTYSGTAGTDTASNISLSTNGEAVLIGLTTSSAFPTTSDAFQTHFGGGTNDVFVSRFSANGDALIYSTFMGGSGAEYGHAVAAKGNRDVYITGATYSNDFPITAGAYRSTGNEFVTKLAADNYRTVVDNASTFVFSSLDCSSSTASCTQGSVGGPINTRTGGEFYQVNDISLPTTAGTLSFERTYSSLTTDLYTTALGYGWTNSLDTRLIFPNDPNGEDGYVLFKKHSANLYRFAINGDGSFSADVGVLGSLVLANDDYILTLSNQSVYTFDGDGTLLTFADAEGHTWEYSYNQDDRLEQVSANNDTRSLALVYDNLGRITSVTDQSERCVSFGYDGAGDLVSATDVLDGEWQYEYDLFHHLTKVIDPSDHTIEQNEYDAQGRVINQWDGLGNLVVGITYDTNSIRTIEDALGNEETHSYDFRNTLTGDMNATGETVSKTYDQNFRPSEITDALNHATQYTWSPDGANLAGITDAAGNSTSISYDSLNNPTQVVDPLNYLTTYEYDGQLLTKTTDALEGETDFTYTSGGYLDSVTDSLGNTTSYTYDAYGQPLTMTDALENTWQYAYDDMGRLISATDPLGRVTRTIYDDAGHVVNTIRNYDENRGANEDNQYNISTTYTYDVRGNQTSVTDTYGRTTHYTYDNAGRLVQTTDPDNHTSTNTYNDAGQLVTITDALGHETHYTYDDAGRQIAVTDALGHTTHTAYNLDGTVASTTDADDNITQYTYDEMKRVVTVTDANGHATHTSYDANGNVATTTDALGNITEYVYDALGRQIEIIDPLDGVTQSFYNAAGNLQQTIDPNGNATTYAYDEGNHLISVTDELGNVTLYEYDDLGRSTAVVDAADNRTEYTYDALDRTVSVSDSLDHTTTTQYDALGHVLANTDANGNTTNYGYDNLYRQVIRTDAEGGETTYAYDAAGNRVSVTDPNENTTTTTYDAVNRPVEVTDPLNHIMTTEYDAAGRVVSVTDANGKITTYEYDALGQQVSITDPNGNVIHTSHDGAGQVTSQTDANGVVTHYGYDDLGRLTSVVENYLDGTTPDNETNVTTTYTYDANGNRLSITDGNGNTTGFVYDELNRLTGEIDPEDYPWQYTYDELGRRTTMTDANGNTTTYSYDDAGHLTAVDYPGTSADVSYSYDAAGRRTGMTDALGTTSWNYDDANRATSITNPFDATVSYTYDANGNRTGLTYPDDKTVSYAYDTASRLTGVTNWDDLTTSYMYDPVGRLLSILRPNGVDSAYIYNDGGQLTQLQSMFDTTVLADYQYAYDANGNRTSVTEAMQSYNDIFADGFESGDLSAWSSAETDNGNLSVSSMTPIEGSYSMQAMFDGQNEMYVEDDTPANETKYHARFYFDSNSITATTGDSLVIFQGRDANGGPVFQVRIRMADTDYEIELLSMDDSQQEVESSWSPLTDHLHAIEMEWQAAHAPDANDGHCTLYVDDVYVTATTGVDNDTERLEDVEMGILSPSSGDFESTVYFDDFTSNRVGHIGLNPNISLSNWIFGDDFESGDLSAWSSAETDNDNLSASTDARIEGDYSLKANADGQNEMYVEDDQPQAESYYDARFYLDPSHVWISPGVSFVAFQGRDANGDPVFQVRVNKLNNGFEIGMVNFDDSQQTVVSSMAPIVGMLHAIEVEWQASSAPGVDDGHSTLYVDDKAIATITGMDNDTVRIEDVEMGILAPSSGDFGGMAIFDDFTSNRGGHIGLNPNVRLPMIFEDAFESGDLSAWSSAQTDGGNLSVTSISPIQGSYSLSATADSQNELYVQDDTPKADIFYHARFYFNPGSVIIPENAYFDIFKGTGTAGTAFSIRLGKVNGDYNVKVVLVHDDETITESEWTRIDYGPNHIEMEWWRAWGADNHDGGICLWVNDSWRACPGDVDNDTKSIDSVLMGILSPSSSTISGTVTFDDLISTRSAGTYIGPDPTVTLPDDNQIFFDTFERGDMSAWGSAETDGGNLNVTGTTPIEGSYSLRATVNGQNEMYVRDDHPIDEASYSARFYFDPDSVVFPVDEYFDIFRGVGSGGTVFAIRLSKIGSDYAIKAVIWDDENNTTETNWTDINNGPNCIELGWFRAWSPEVPDGRLQLWVNGTQKDYPGDIDNYSKTVNYVEMGVLSPSSADISGTVTFDDFGSNDWGETRIGLDPNVPFPDYNQFVSDGFESGDMSAWSSAETDGGNLSVTTVAALEGNYGLQGTLDDQNEMYVEDNSPTSEHYYNARFYFDPNSVVIPTGDMFDLLRGSGLGGEAFSVRLGWANDGYAVKVVMVADDSSTTESAWIPIDDAVNYIEIEWARSWTVNSNDGWINIWVNSNGWANPNGIVNGTKTIGFVQMGILSPTSDNISGTVYFDDFASGKSGIIGQNANLMRMMAIPMAVDASTTPTPTAPSTPTEEGLTQTPTPTATSLPTEEEITQTPEASLTATETQVIDTPEPTGTGTEVIPTAEYTNTLTVPATPTASATDAVGYLAPKNNIFMVAAHLQNPAGRILQDQDQPTLTGTATPTRTQTPQLSSTPLPSATPTRLPTFTATMTPQRATRTLIATSTPQAENRLQGLLPYAVDGQLSMSSALLSEVGNWTIDYTYDPLNRLTAADYSNGDYYYYIYDAVGNRMNQASSFGGTETTTAYAYDTANRLTSVGGVTHTWDNNGNLLSDGVNTYTYDGANRLIAVNGQSSTTSYTYDGLGDRLQQTVGGQTTTYTLDLNASFTQVLSDGTNTYLYGVTRIAQQNGTDAQYYLGDALNSVRQLTNSTGDVSLTRAYDPYGSTILNVGYQQTAYGYTGEYTDSTRQIYLRARMYDPYTGRFISKDTWQGNYKRPETNNKWIYANGNPVGNADPSGYCSHAGWSDATGIFTKDNCDLLESGNLRFREDWYYAFADTVENELPQTAANIRHYLDGSGSELQLDPAFMKNKIYGWPKLSKEVNKLTKWYIRNKLNNMDGCELTQVGPDIFAHGFTPPYEQAWVYWPFDKSQLDISGALGSFRLDLEIKGTITPEKTWLYSRASTGLSLHLVVLDFYNWHKGLGVSYKGNAIDDEWADSLSEAGMAKEYLVRGDLTVEYNDLVNENIFGLGAADNPPGEWVRASCIGSQFDVNQDGFGSIDYCGNPMK